MNKHDFRWETRNSEDGVVWYEGENDRFIGNIELVGEDLYKNQMWSASLFDKRTRAPIPVSDYGLPFISVASAKAAITRAILRQEDSI